MNKKSATHPIVSIVANGVSCKLPREESFWLQFILIAVNIKFQTYSAFCNLQAPKNPPEISGGSPFYLIFSYIIYESIFSFSFFSQRHRNPMQFHPAFQMIPVPVPVSSTHDTRVLPDCPAPDCTHSRFG